MLQGDHDDAGVGGDDDGDGVNVEGSYVGGGEDSHDGQVNDGDDGNHSDDGDDGKLEEPS